MRSKKIISAMLAACMLFTASALTGCGDSKSGTEETAVTEDNSPYAYLKADIVGMWGEAGGATLTDDPYFGQCYQFFEFAADGTVYYHYLAYGDDGIVRDYADQGESYRIDENMLVLVDDNVGATIEISNGIMTMTNQNSSSEYQKLTYAEMLNVGLYCKDETLNAEEVAFEDKRAKEEYAESVNAEREAQGLPPIEFEDIDSSESAEVAETDAPSESEEASSETAETTVTE